MWFCVTPVSHTQMFAAHNSANPTCPLGSSLNKLPLWTHQMNFFLSRVQTQVLALHGWHGPTSGCTLQNKKPRLEQELHPGDAVCPKISSISSLFSASWLRWLETEYGCARMHGCVYIDTKVSSASMGFYSPSALCSSSAAVD